MDSPDDNQSFAKGTIRSLQNVIFRYGLCKTINSYKKSCSNYIKNQKNRVNYFFFNRPKSKVSSYYSYNFFEIGNGNHIKSHLKQQL